MKCSVEFSPSCLSFFDGLRNDGKREEDARFFAAQKIAEILFLPHRPPRVIRKELKKMMTRKKGDS